MSRGWTVAPLLSGSENHRGYRIRDERSLWIADVTPLDPDGKLGAEIANKMAAAPDLYEALDDCVSLLEAMVGTDADSEGAVTEQVRSARHALARARGEVEPC